jgi:hypothetical protein
MLLIVVSLKPLYLIVLFYASINEILHDIAPAESAYVADSAIDAVFA